MGIPQRKPDQDLRVFKERRDRLAKAFPGSAFVLPSRPEYIRNGSVPFSHRQDSNLFYLTGFEEPESILLFRPGLAPEYVLFVRPKDLAREVWNGFRYGPKGAAHEFQVDAAYPIDEFEARAPELLRATERMYFPLGMAHALDARMMQVLEATRLLQGRSGAARLPILDPNGPLGEMRVIKSAYEISMMRKAAQLSAEGHREVMRACRPGLNERTLHGVFIGSIMKQGSAREGYGGICAAGANATALHYVSNDQQLKDGDLFLIDCGGEHNYYTGDITRTYPINGKFTDEQGRFYQKVLTIQKAIIEMVRPGVPYADLQTRTVEMLTDAMIEFGFSQQSRQEMIKSLAFKKYYPHGVSHYLGMDVHDLGLYNQDGEPRPLEPGMVITIEPGLYVPFDDDSAASGFRGLGVRIEDDVLVTPQGCEVLSSHAPKEINDLEQIIGKG
jgi:Xaa-Pro aminopeptidase